jgi:hypothetical protein
MPFCPVLIGTTPGVSDNSWVKLRPFSGRSFTCLVAMTCTQIRARDLELLPAASTVTF